LEIVVLRFSRWTSLFGDSGVEELEVDFTLWR
jgi:hypothetical protein